MIFSIETKRFFALVVMASFIVVMTPLTASALVAEEERPTKKEPRANIFCEKIDDAEAKMLTKLSERKGKTDRTAAINEKRDKRIAAFEARKDERKATREARYEKLNEHAKTDEQKEAVKTFVDTVKDLAETRHDAVKEAVEIFEGEVVTLIRNRNDSVDTRADEVKNLIKESFADAKASCEDGGSAAEVRTQLKADLADMRTTLKAKHDPKKHREELTEARDVRKAAVAEAKATFLEGYKAAKEELKTAFDR